MRCERHDLACGPDGSCVLCQRDRGTSSVRRIVWIGAAFAAVVIGGAKLGYTALSSGRGGAPAVAALTSPGPVAAPDGVRSPGGPLRAPALPPSPSPAARAETEPATSSRVPAPPDGPPSGVHVVVYTTSWCPYCKKAKAWMNGNGVVYEERDIERSAEYASSMRAINPRGGIPTFDIEGDVMVGFSPADLMARMRGAAARRSVRRP